jgi:amino acid efflux transporter
LAQLVGLGLDSPAEWLVRALACLIAYRTVHTYVAGFSRLVYAEARIGNLPAWLGSLHPRHHTPTRVLWPQLLPWVPVLAWTQWGRLSLAALVAWPSAVCIALCIVAMPAAWRLLPPLGDRILAAVGLATFLAALGFLGWVALYPAGVLAASAVLVPRRFRTGA